MIRPIAYSNIKSFKQAEAPEQVVQQLPVQETVDYDQWQKENKKPSKAKVFGRFVATQFLAGAAFSSILDGASNIYRLIAKKQLIPAKDILLRSGYYGAMFTLMGFVLFGIEKLLFSRKEK